MNFDYSMAMGVRKTFQRIYRQNLARAVMLLEDRTDPESEIKANIQKIKEETGLYPKLEDCEEYFQAEMPFLLAHYSQDEAEMRKCQAFAHYRATKETDRATLSGHGGPDPQLEHHALPGRGSDAVLFD